MPIFNRIKYSGPSRILIWKYPKENILTGSQLIVGPSQEAVFVRDGQICDVLGPGSHTLDTDNIPVLGSLVNLAYGGKSPFTTEIFFVNKLAIMDIKWGTPVPIQLNDPVYHILLPLRSFGQYGISVADSALFVEKITGASKEYTTDELVAYFRGLVSSRIVDEISGCLVKRGISFVEVNAHISEIAEEAARKITPLLAECGIRLIHFTISSINAPEDDPSVVRLRKALDAKNEKQVAGESTYGETAEAAYLCRACGCTMAAGEDFCRKCGAPRRLAKVCAICGREAGAEDNFCTKCGAKLPPGGPV